VHFRAVSQFHIVHKSVFLDLTFQRYIKSFIYFSQYFNFYTIKLPHFWRSFIGFFPIMKKEYEKD